jgi:hypothetical protein
MKRLVSFLLATRVSAHDGGGLPVCFTLGHDDHCRAFFVAGWGTCEDGYKATWFGTCRAVDDHGHHWWQSEHPPPPSSPPPLVLPPSSPPPTEPASGDDASGDYASCES